MIDWIKGEPPRNHEEVYLLKFASGIMATGTYRYGKLGEPNQGEIQWRCDCCGRYATPIAYAELKDE